MNKNNVLCGECSFFRDEDASGFGGCLLKDFETMRCDEQCDLNRDIITRNGVIKGLHEYQKWRRGDKSAMPRPYVIGVIIDAAIRYLRKP